METPEIPEPGQLIAGKYRLTGVLGRGGMGVVFDAHHEMLDRKVAIKVLAPDVLANAEAVRRFMNEARAAARITSDRVVQVLDVGLLDSGLPFMVMERLEGMDLGQLRERENVLGVSRAVDLLLEAIEGVAHAHVEGIIHRDLKPANLFLAHRTDGSSGVKVLDFGISKLTDIAGGNGSVTATNAVIGSPLYMSPEQLRNSKSIDLRADIWSLGVIAYELLAGRVPFVGTNVIEIFIAIQETDPSPIAELRADVPAELEAVVRRCLARSVDARFANVFALARALGPFAGAPGRAALERIDAQAAARGVPVEVAQAPAATVAPSAELASTQVDTTSVSAAVSASSTAPPPQLTGVAGVTGESTSAPWSSTRSGKAGPRSKAQTGAVIAVVLLLGGGIAASLLRTKHPAASEAVVSATVAAHDVATQAQEPEPQPSPRAAEQPPASSPSPAPSPTAVEAPTLPKPLSATATAAPRQPAGRPAAVQRAPQGAARQATPHASANPLVMQPF